MKIVVSIIIPVFNASHHLPKLFKALNGQVDNEVEIIFVDNGSKDNSKELIADFASIYTNVVIIQELEYQSSYAARNSGVEASRGQFLSFTDADCIPSPTFIETLLLLAKQKPENMIVSGQVNLEISDPDNLAEQYDFHFHLDQEKYAAEKYGATANLFIAKSAFIKNGPFLRVKSGGDQEFCKRAIRNGLDFIFEEQLVVMHPARDTTKELLKKQLRVGKGKVQNFNSLYPSFRSKLIFILRQVMGIFYPRNQVRKISLLYKQKKHPNAFLLKLLLYAVFIANLQRGSFLFYLIWRK